ncbi:MAG: phosphoribosylamine--glycine ligase [Pyrinomonadaceae bacterium]|nr:phosphoribosylamine--glycine ligase [Acidobacteriota bacterium]MBP7375260.1 phosphoribosylamine--glycine ligase [Pyrinomonadaceae bacterium]
MKVLVIGSGGREHAICYAFKKSQRLTELFCANGNAGITEIAQCVPIKHDEIERLADFASRKSIDLTFVGGETPLALGVVDEFESRGLKIVGPCKAASQLEASKSFAKDFMARHSVPTAKYVTAHSPASAIASLESGTFGGEYSPVVVKADGLAAGKGVVVAANRAEAVSAISEMADLVGADAAEKIVLEECLFGKEVSLLMFADGDDFALMPAVRDHKRIGEGDTGPNTGGMGTFTDASLLSDAQLEEIVGTIVRPTLNGCQSEGFRFRGILFLGVMMTANGPKLLEYNVRFGDPETQSILVRLETDLVDICEAMLEGKLSDLTINWREGSSACVVLASQGYPAKPKTGDLIKGVDEAKSVPGIEIFHAGTSALTDGEYFTAGGRVLGVTATGSDLTDALAAAYESASRISFNGMQYRRDIGK